MDANADAPLNPLFPKLIGATVGSDTLLPAQHRDTVLVEEAATTNLTDSSPIPVESVSDPGCRFVNLAGRIEELTAYVNRPQHAYIGSAQLGGIAASIFANPYALSERSPGDALLRYQSYFPGSLAESRLPELIGFTLVGILPGDGHYNYILDKLRLLEKT